MILPILFGCIILFLIVGAAFSFINRSTDSGFTMTLVATFLIFATFVVPYATSYGTYLGMKGFYEATIHQYRDSVEMYEDKAIIQMDKAITDFRYQGYQESMAKFIVDLRSKVVRYNEMYIKKNTMKDNIFFGCYIIGPDEDMRIMELRG